MRFYKIVNEKHFLIDFSKIKWRKTIDFAREIGLIPAKFKFN